MVKIKKLALNLVPIISMFFLLGNIVQAEDLKPNQGTDIHVHVSTTRMGDMEFSPDRAMFALWSSGFNRAGIISNSYDASNNPDCKSDCKPDKDWTKKENDYIASIIKKSPKGFIGFCGVDLNAEWASEEVKRCSEIGLNGLKVHTMANGLDLLKEVNFKKINSLAKLAGDVGLKIIVHSSFNTTAETKKLIEIVNNNPNTTFIMAHMLGNDYKSLSDIKNPNTYLEFSATLINQYFKGNKDDVRDQLRKFGIDKVLFGSDWPVIHPSETLKVLKEYNFTKEEMDKIIWKNSETLFPIK